jgi:DNA-directed RNA polymerase subunit RPC12/RpoP
MGRWVAAMTQAMVAGLFELAKSRPREHHAHGAPPMGETNSNPTKTSAPVITERDILFECPSCGKNLVVDESAEGAIVDCPRCAIKVIVPPKVRPEIRTSTPQPPPPAPSAPPNVTTTASSTDLQARGATLGNQLREIQMQRTEIHNRVASRLNELNRDLVLLARLDATQQKLVGEWNQLLGSQKTATGSGASPAKTQDGGGTPSRVAPDAE